MALVLAICAGATPALAAPNHRSHHHRRHHAHKRRRSRSHEDAGAHRPARAHRRPRKHSPAHAPGNTPAQGCANTELTPTAQNLQLIEAATLCLVNRERVTRGEAPLRANARLRQAAQGHTESMSIDDYFEHFGPGGQTPLSRMRAAGYISSDRVGYEVGENIAWGTLAQATPCAIVAGWMASPGHRANILDPDYRETGIGVSPRPPAALAEGQPGAIYTQDFGVIIDY
jgi:uncharacterized protein YkwD